MQRWEPRAGLAGGPAGRIMGDQQRWGGRSQPAPSVPRPYEPQTFTKKNQAKFLSVKANGWLGDRWGGYCPIRDVTALALRFLEATCPWHSGWGGESRLAGLVLTGERSGGINTPQTQCADAHLSHCPEREAAWGAPVGVLGSSQCAGAPLGCWEDPARVLGPVRALGIWGSHQGAGKTLSGF